MTGTTPFPFESLSETPSRPTSEDAPLEGTGAAHRGRDGRWTALSSSGSNSGDQCEREHRYTADDLTRAVDEARRKTALEVEAELRSELEISLERRRCDLLTAIRDQLQRQQSTFDDELAHMSVVTQSLAVALAKAIVPRAIEREPLIDIADTLKAALVRLVKEPSLEFCLPPDLVESGTEILTGLAKEAGFKGGVVATADPSLGKGDATVRWQGGMADRRLDRLQAEALELVDRWLPVPAKITEADEDTPPPLAEAVSENPIEMSKQIDSRNP